MIRFNCACGKQMYAREEDIGKLMDCSACARCVIVPETGIEGGQAIEEESRPAGPGGVISSDGMVEKQPPAVSESENQALNASQARRNGLANLSLIFGVMSLFFNILTGLPALLLGVILLLNNDRKTEGLRSRRVAIAGIAAACIGITINIVGLFFSARYTREEATRKTSQNNLKQIGLALHSFDDTNAGLPGNILAKNGKPLLSWRVAILPYIEEQRLYQRFNLDEPWDSDNNKKLIEEMPKVYTPFRVKAKPGETFYQIFVGEAALFGGKKKPSLPGSVTDGTENTGMVFEAGEPVIWSKPADLPFDAKNPLPKLGGLFDGECNVLMCDGSVRLLKKDADEKELKNLIMPADGNVIDWKKLEK